MDKPPRKHPTHTEKNLDTADALWKEISPTSVLFGTSASLIFRGQANSNWPLTPSILRPRNHLPVISSSKKVNASEMVFLEIEYLTRFMEHCDKIGLAIPNDSQTFRSTICNTQTADRHYKDPSSWPDPRILDLMAMAQHHGVPTRLLDWTTKAYTAAYFTASSALASYNDWKEDGRLAIWVLDRDAVGLHAKVVLHNSPGATSRNLAAQGGLFTVHPHNGERNGSFVIEGFEYLLSDLPDPPLVKLTIPVFEAARLLYLCSLAGFSATDVYPNADGAGKAVIDWMNIDGAIGSWNTEKTRVIY